MVVPAPFGSVRTEAEFDYALADPLLGRVATAGVALAN
jgi:hypothetical protein